MFVFKKTRWSFSAHEDVEFTMDVYSRELCDNIKTTSDFYFEGVDLVQYIGVLGVKMKLKPNFKGGYCMHLHFKFSSVCMSLLKIFLFA